MGTATTTPNGSWQHLNVTRTVASGDNSSTHLDLNPYMAGASASDVVRVDLVREPTDTATQSAPRTPLISPLNSWRSVREAAAFAQSNVHRR